MMAAPTITIANVNLPEATREFIQNAIFLAKGLKISKATGRITQLYLRFLEDSERSSQGRNQWKDRYDS